MNRAPIIVIEGLDGVGKTTLSRGLARALGARWLTTPGAALRDPETRRRFEAAYASCRVARSVAYGATVLAVGKEALALAQAGTPVVIDRYWLSTLAYAPAEAEAALAPLEDLLECPDLTLFATAPEAVRRARLQGRTGALSEADLETLVGARARQLTERYRSFARRPAAGTFWELDCSGTAEDVLAAALDRVFHREVRAA